MSKIFIGIIFAMLLAFGGYYWISEKRIATLTENNAKLPLAAQTNQETINKLEEDNQAYEVANKELQLKYREAEKYGDELSK